MLGGIVKLICLAACRAGVEVDILLDSLGANKAPSDIIATMKNAGCQMEYFHRVEAEGIIFPWKLLRYNYRSHRRVLVIDGRIGFTGGYGISEAWTGNGRTPEHWRDTNARIERRLDSARVGAGFCRTLMNSNFFRCSAVNRQA
jgi:cardiolipin synthase A/B